MAAWSKWPLGACLLCQNVCIALTSSIIPHKVHVSTRKSGGPNIWGLSKGLGPLIMVKKLVKSFYEISKFDLYNSSFESCSKGPNLCIVDGNVGDVTIYS